MNTETDAYAEQSPSAEDLAALQLKRLQATLHHAYDNVEHYRRKFDAAGVRPQDCQSLADLARFPFTSFRARYWSVPRILMPSGKGRPVAGSRVSLLRLRPIDQSPRLGR